MQSERHYAVSQSRLSRGSFANHDRVCMLEESWKSHMGKCMVPWNTNQDILTRSCSMPSTHSASITFLATYILLASLHLPVHPLFPANIRLVPFIVVPYASGVVWSRVWLGHHSWPQVLAGGSYGIVFATVWFEIWRSGLNDKLQLLEMEVIAWLDRYLHM